MLWQVFNNVFCNGCTENQKAAAEAPSGVVEGSTSAANVTCSLDTGSDAETCALNPTPAALVSPPKK